MDCGCELNNKGEYVTDFIDLEMDKKNIKVLTNDDNDLIVRIFPDSELHNCIKKSGEGSNEHRLKFVLGLVKIGLERNNTKGLLELVDTVLNQTKR